MRWQREPHRLLFPLGALLAGVGVLPWIPFALGLESIYQPIFSSIGFRSLFHPLVEVQASLTCFAAGYVFSALPRRTGSAPPAPWQLAVAAVAPLAVLACAALDRFALAQLAWGIEACVVVAFALSRRPRAPLPPAALAWLPAGLLMGLLGGALAQVGDARAGELFWLYDAGRALLLQGLFTALVVGSADLLRGETGATNPRKALPRAIALLLHLVLALLFLGTFALEPRWPRLSYLSRALCTLLALAAPLRAAVVESGARAQRLLLRLAPQAVPLGFALVAIQPRWRRIGLHVVYLGSFASLAFALVLTALERLPPQAPRAEVHGRLDLLQVAATLLAMSLIGRVLLEADPLNFRFWLGVASLSYAGLSAICLRLAAATRPRRS